MLLLRRFRLSGRVPTERTGQASSRLKFRATFGGFLLSNKVSEIHVNLCCLPTGDSPGKSLAVAVATSLVRPPGPVKTRGGGQLESNDRLNLAKGGLPLRTRKSAKVCMKFSVLVPDRHFLALSIPVYRHAEPLSHLQASKISCQTPKQLVSVGNANGSMKQKSAFPGRSLFQRLPIAKVRPLGSAFFWILLKENYRGTST